VVPLLPFVFFPPAAGKRDLLFNAHPPSAPLLLCVFALTPFSICVFNAKPQ